MRTLTQRINLTRHEEEGAHIMYNVGLGCAVYDTLCLACAELDIDLSKVTDKDFDECVDNLADFISTADESTGYTVSIWFGGVHDVDIVINQGDKQVIVSTHLNKDKNTHKKIKQLVLDEELDWLECDVFVANFPEKGRYLAKASGRTQINAGG